MLSFSFSCVSKPVLRLASSCTVLQRRISRCIYIRGLPSNTAEFQVKNMLQEYGEIEYVKVYDNTAFKKSSCLVGFLDVDSAVSVVDELDQRPMSALLHHKISVSFSNRRYYGYEKLYSAGGGRGGGGGGGRAGGGKGGAHAGGRGGGGSANSASNSGGRSSNNGNNNVVYKKSSSQDDADHLVDSEGEKSSQ